MSDYTGLCFRFLHVEAGLEYYSYTPPYRVACGSVPRRIDSGLPALSVSCRNLSSSGAGPA